MVSGKHYALLRVCNWRIKSAIQSVLGPVAVIGDVGVGAAFAVGR